MTQSETRICQNCKTSFVIDASDFAFYERIKVPAPTWCPECRHLRRLVWANAYALYKRKCDAPGHREMIISKFAPSDKIKVYDSEFWWSGDWDSLSYGREYDFSRPFFEQFKELLLNVPLKNFDSVKSVNCDYCPSVVECKNCYLVVGGYRSENCLYGDTVALSRNSIDNFALSACENCYECVHCSKSYNLRLSSFSRECIDSTFLEWCNNCSNCFGCVGLKNKQYHIFNQPYSREKYENLLAGFNLGGWRGLVSAKEEFSKFSLSQPKKYAAITKSVDCTGHIIENSKNCKNSFGVVGGAENSRFVLDGGYGLKDSYDVFAAGGRSELLYEVSSTGLDCSRVFFSRQVQQSLDVYYSYNCFNSQHLFGCSGLRNKQYCVLNKQYTKEQYEELVPKIVNQMDSRSYIDKRRNIYRYGEFFPPELSFFAYNETAAQDYFPKTEEDLVATGFEWREPPEKNYEVTVTSENLPDSISEVDNNIVKEVISCAHRGECLHKCSVAFRIVPEELAFYRQTNLPLPRLCPNCRYFERLAIRNTLRLWHRQCQCAGVKSENGTYTNTITHPHGAGKCPNEFETSYSPERSEIVYCESCYNAEVV